MPFCSLFSGWLADSLTLVSYPAFCFAVLSFFDIHTLWLLCHGLLCNCYRFSPCGYHVTYIKYLKIITRYFKLVTTSVEFQTSILLLLPLFHFRLFTLTMYIFFYCVTTSRLLQLWLLLFHSFLNSAPSCNLSWSLGGDPVFQGSLWCLALH